MSLNELLPLRDSAQFDTTSYLEPNQFVNNSGSNYELAFSECDLSLLSQFGSQNYQATLPAYLPLEEPWLATNENGDAIQSAALYGPFNGMQGHQPNSQSNWLNASSQGETTVKAAGVPAPPSPPSSPSPHQHKCSQCDNRFHTERGRKRHEKTVHLTGAEPAYLCKCGYHNVRKDNYLRHLRACRLALYIENAVYICKCTLWTYDHDRHYNHVKDCRFR
ncbi:hypothetical protein K449DRAFT_419880 [Hypoxylon sp. EC38]|nr:hypothetical protein K449DRAFT_419880 [Hypoxylon sp. EC38]